MLHLGLPLPLVVPMQAHSGDPRQGGAMSMGPIWHMCIAICPAKHRPLPLAYSWLKNIMQKLPYLYMINFFNEKTVIIPSILTGSQK